jgi:diacylglycerol kinase
MYDGVDRFLSSWSSAKTFLEYATDISHDVLHFVLGLCIWLLIAALIRRPISSAAPFLLTLALALINEAADLWVDIWPEQARQFGELTKDLFTTLAVPFLMFVLARFYPPLFSRRIDAPAGSVDDRCAGGTVPRSEADAIAARGSTDASA